MKLEIFNRKEVGKGANRRLKKMGKVPAILYGGKENKLVSIAQSTLKSYFLNTKGKNQILDLEIEGSETKKAIIHDYQYSSINKQFIHIDFLEVSENTVLNLEIPIKTIGTSKVAKMGGIEQTIRHTIPVTCKAKDIPEFIEVDVTELDFGGSIHVLDIEYPKGVKPIATGRNFTLISTSGVSEEVVEEVAEETEGQTEEKEEKRRKSLLAFFVAQVKIITGLGNPTAKYENTLHNIGFSVLSVLQEKLQTPSKTNQFYSIFCKGKYEKIDYGLLFPQTYMNLSGKAVASCKNFYKISYPDILVVCDSLDLPLARVRYKEKGSHGGHNGLKDIIEKMGSQEFPRLTIGIGRPTHKDQVKNYVLKKISSEQQEKLQVAITQAVDLCIQFLFSKAKPQTIKN